MAAINAKRLKRVIKAFKKEKGRDMTREEFRKLVNG
jgi:hypothetical protein